jgi:hypothetical protein
MMHSFQIVSLEEGFDEVVNVDNIDMLAKLAAANP